MAGRDDAAEAGAEAARHPRLQRELGRHVAAGAQLSDGLEHRGRTAGVDLDVVVGVEPLGHQLGDQAMVADAAVVGRDLWGGEQHRSGGVGRVSEAKQRRRLAAELVLPDRQRRDPDATSDKQRRASLAGRCEPCAERPDEHQVVAGLKLAQSLGAGTDVLDQEMKLLVFPLAGR